MQPNFNLYFAGCALLLALSVSVSIGSPVCPKPSLDTEKWEKLLNHVGELLQDKVLLKGHFECSKQEVELSSKTKTVSACEPNTEVSGQDSRCSGQRNTTFSESECLGNIQADLEHYITMLKIYQKKHPDADSILSTTVKIIQDLLNCPLSSTQGNAQAQDSASQWSGEAFGDRVRLCKVLKGFQARVITINRAVSYITSGDHKK